MVEFKNCTKCPALHMNRTCSFKAIFPNIAKVFMGVFVYWEISSLINVSSKFLQVRKCWESERFVLKKKPALILVLRSLSKCESEFYCQHQTTWVRVQWVHNTFIGYSVSINKSCCHLYEDVFNIYTSLTLMVCLKRFRLFLRSKNLVGTSSSHQLFLIQTVKY